MNKKCPVCGAAELIHDTRDMPYIYKGETTTIPAVTGDFCPACCEFILNREHGDRYSELLGQFQRQVNAVAGVLLADIGREIGLTNEDFVALDQVRDKTPAEPLKFE